MQRFLVLFGLAIVIALTACHSKKILIYASSDIQVDNTGKNITVSEGTTHHEKELDFSGGSTVELAIQTPSGKFILQAPDDGLYIANLKNDTVVGSFQHVGADNGEARITQDALKQKLDSLQKLVMGQNISAAGRNYFVAPGKITWITAQTKAKVFGPYMTIPGDFNVESAPEIYKFYTNKEIWEIIDKLQKMTEFHGNDKTDAPDKVNTPASGKK
jgi:hypothetical protein